MSVSQTIKLDASAFAGQDKAFEQRETHAAVVYLVGDRAYKIKKAVKLPYLDFSTKEKRAAALHRELEVNRIWSPSLYLGVSERNGEPYLEMRRFDEQHLLAELIKQDQLTDVMCENLAATVACSHRLAPVVSVNGVSSVEKLVRQVDKAFADSPEIFDESAADEFRTLAFENVERHKALLMRRAQSGFVRRCHGDLHCRNIVVENGQPMLFDAIEFSEDMATIDVIYDLAFLLMDLSRRKQIRAANLVMNTYFDLMRDQEDLSGIALLPLFLAIRAGVRALVAADRAHDMHASEREIKVGEARSYLSECLRFLAPRKPLLVAIGGLSGTGKSTLARSLAPALGPPPGALVIRSDVERKRHAGVSLSARLPPDSYNAQAARRVYDAIKSRASRVLTAQYTAVVDAVYATPEERAGIERLATECDAPFYGLWLQSTGEIMRGRVEKRIGDASDATSEVVDKQLSYDLGAIDWRIIDASQAPQMVLDSARRTLQV